MRILHVNASYKPASIYGGPTVSVSSLCEALAAAGITTDVFTTTANGKTELDVITGKPVLIDGVHVTYFKRSTKDHTHFSPRLVRQLWKSANEYDAIHIHAWWNTVSVLSCLIAQKKKVPVIVSPRGMLSDYSFSTKNIGKKGIIHQLAGKRLLEKSFIHVTAESEKLEIENLIKSKGISVIPNIIQLPTQRFTRADKEIFKLIFLSRIDAKKGLDILIDALATVNHPWQLTIAGIGEEDYIASLKAQTEQRGISAHINWIGFVSDAKFELLSEHDLFVLPSHNENFGNAVIESLSTGTAVLLSESVGLAGYVRENNLGWACNASAESFSEAINDIITNKQQELVQIRDKAPDTIKRDFAPPVLVQRYINLYRQAIANE